MTSKAIERLIEAHEEETSRYLKYSEPGNFRVGFVEQSQKRLASIERSMVALTDAGRSEPKEQG